MYAAHLEFNQPAPKRTHLSHVMSAFEAFHPAAGTAPSGLLDVQISVPGFSIDQSAVIALNAAKANGLEVVRVEVMTEEQFARRQGTTPVPELVGATEAAVMLGVTRQAVQQMHADGRLAGQTVGKSLVFGRDQVEAIAERRRRTPSLEES